MGRGGADPWDGRRIYGEADLWGGRSMGWGRIHGMGGGSMGWEADPWDGRRIYGEADLWGGRRIYGVGDRSMGRIYGM